MNSSSADLLCPLDNRRTSTQLYVQLFVVHLTVVTSYCHLLSISNEPLPSWRPLFFIFTPINIIVQYGVALLAIAISAILSITYGKRNPRFVVGSLQISLQWLFGKVPEHQGGYSQVSTEQTAISDDGRSISKIFGRIFIAAALMAQCICTIYLYTRRRPRNCVALVDQTIFGLACGGLAIALLTIGTASKVSLFNKPVPVSQRSMLDEFIVFCRYSAHPHLNSEEAEQYYFHFTKNGVLSLLIMVGLGQYGLFRSVTHIVTGHWSGEAGEPTIEDFVFLWSALMVIGFIIMKLPTSSPLGSWNECKWDLTEPSMIGVKIFVFIALLPMFGVLVRNYARLFTQISLLGSWPVDKACPLLWTDPLANYIWWLA